MTARACQHRDKLCGERASSAGRIEALGARATEERLERVPEREVRREATSTSCSTAC